LARQAFIEGLELLGLGIGIILPKGGGTETIKIGKQILKQYGEPQLLELCKEHFKNLDAILGKTRQ
jgi:ribonuclease HIII